MPESRTRRRPPAKKGEKDSGRLGPIGRIQATFTDSATRIGHEAAVYCLVLVLAITATMMGQSALHVAALIGSSVAGWAAMKCVGAYIHAGEKEKDLDNARVKGGSIRDKHERTVKGDGNA